MIIEAARQVPALHVAFLVNRPNHPYIKSLIALGEQYGMSERLHFRGYVDYADLPRFLSTATMGIHPMQTGPINHEIAQINENMSRFADGRTIRYVNVNAKLAGPDGTLVPGVMMDGLHPSVKGYQIWADALKPILTELLGPPAATDQAPPPTGDPSARRP